MQIYSYKLQFEKFFTRPNYNGYDYNQKSLQLKQYATCMTITYGLNCYELNIYHQIHLCQRTTNLKSNIYNKFLVKYYLCIVLNNVHF